MGAAGGGDGGATQGASKKVDHPASSDKALTIDDLVDDSVDYMLLDTMHRVLQSVLDRWALVYHTKKPVSLIIILIIFSLNPSVHCVLDYPLSPLSPPQQF